jgi:Lon protease-like protein
MSDLLSIFPLPTVVLFPNVFLPLHIFEPRYREMVADALAGDRMIGMVLLKRGWESAYEGRPPVYPIGCSGVISHVERRPDGRYNIVLRGLERFRIIEEDHGRSYRRAIVEPVPERDPQAEDRESLRRQRSRLERLLAPALETSGAGAFGTELGHIADLRQDRVASSGERTITSSMSDGDLVNALAQYLDLEPLEKQALLEQHSLRSRADSLVELLEMKIMVARMPGPSKTSH